jgi:hypothetical protein
VKRYGGKARFLVVYLREAHPADSPRSREGWSKGIDDPADLAERREVARRCQKELDLGIPFAIDDMEDATAKAYAAYPDRLFIVGSDGRIAFAGGKGPRGFKVEEMTKRLAEILEAR